MNVNKDVESELVSGILEETSGKYIISSNQSLDSNPEFKNLQLEVERLEAELSKRDAELTAAQENIKTMDASFKETRWALASEVAEKHDQVLDLRRTIATLEETLRQADMQTHFKDDIIKKMRLELKHSKTIARSEGRKLYDVVTEVTQQQRRLEEVMTPELTQGQRKDGFEEGKKSCPSEMESRSSFEGPTPRERVALLRETLQADIQQMELNEFKSSLAGDSSPSRIAALGEQWSMESLEASQQRSILLDVVETLEKSLKNVSFATDSREEFLRTESDRLCQVKSRLLATEPKQLEGIACMGGGDGGDCSLPNIQLSEHGITRSKTQFAVNTLRDIQSHVDELVVIINRNAKISEIGDGEGCDGKLKMLNAAFRDVECYLLDISKTWGDPSTGDDACLCHKDDRELLSSQLMDKDKQIKSLMETLSALRENTEFKKKSEDQKEVHAIHSSVNFINEILKKLSVSCDINENEVPNSETLISRLNLLNEILFHVCLPELQADLAAEQKLVSNKEETLQNLHTMIELREKQVESFSAKVQILERQLEEQRQVIAELQQAVQDCKKLEMESKENEFCSLRFEICELELKQRMTEKECREKDQKLEQTQSDNLNLRRRLNSVEEDLRMVQPELKELRQKSANNENISADLEKELQQRDAEIAALQKQVRDLEVEAELEVERSEGRYQHDTKVIAVLKKKVDELQSQLMRLRSEYSEVLADAEVKYIAEKSFAVEQHYKLKIQNKGFCHTIRDLTFENQALSEQALKYQLKEEECSRNFLKQVQALQADYDRKVKELHEELKISEEKYENARVEWANKVRSLEKKTQHAEEEILRLGMIVETCKRREKELIENIRANQDNFKTLQNENIQLQQSLVARQDQLDALEKRELSDLNELEATVKTMRGDMIRLKKKCSLLTTNLEKQYSLREELEAEVKTHQRLISKLEKNRNEWAQRLDEAQASELQVRKAMNRLKEEGLLRLRQEISAKTAAEEKLSKVEAEIAQLQSDYEDLRASHSKVLETLKSSERAKNNIEKFLNQVEEEQRRTEVEKASCERELSEIKRDKGILEDRVISLGKVKERELHNICAKLNDANAKIRDYEEILTKQERIVEVLKTEVYEANASCLWMREEALNLIENTEPRISSIKMSGGGDARRSEDQRITVAAMNESLFAEAQRKKPHDVNSSNPWSPAPPAAHTVWARQQTRLHDSNECFVESGFQSMMPSPIHMMSDMRGYGPDQDSEECYPLTVS